MAHLLKYDSILGQLHHNIKADGDSVHVDDKKIRVFAIKDPAEIDWSSLGVQVVVESTGPLYGCCRCEEAFARIGEESHHFGACQG